MVWFVYSCRNIDCHIISSWHCKIWNKVYWLTDRYWSILIIGVDRLSTNRNVLVIPLLFVFTLYLLCNKLFYSFVCLFVAVDVVRAKAAKVCLRYFCVVSNKLFVCLCIGCCCFSQNFNIAKQFIINYIIVIVIESTRFILHCCSFSMFISFKLIFFV